jgi:prolyl-tRNA editing enzyme YbaK/EbsC (Cys-tRNA(Pro) deacylase)
MSGEKLAALLKDLRLSSSAGSGSGNGLKTKTLLLKIKSQDQVVLYVTQADSRSDLKSIAKFLNVKEVRVEKPESHCKFFLDLIIHLVTHSFSIW